ncbi:BsuBI/PstI family type II restriction endonuclease [Okeania sp. SIO1I7]|uniref:BsuBI/PstI family type II restriction endonuclease n=1 Tax=Okeania sp. SIO1I7 TaxID=2607772 RepID=UPI003454ABAC
MRRKDLKLIVLAGIIIPSAANPNSARNDGTRSFALNPDIANLVKNFGSNNWEEEVDIFLANRVTLEQQLSSQREISLIPVNFPSGKVLNFSPGKHNELQKAIIESFLPRYGYGAEILYVGDTAKKFLHLEKNKLKKLNFFELSNGELPDIRHSSLLTTEKLDLFDRSCS